MASICIAILGLVLLFWSFAPAQRVLRHQVILPEQMQLKGVGNLPETRLLTLDYPSSLRVGEAERLKMTVEVQEQATAAGIVNVYETHRVVAEARFDLTEMTVRPPGTVSEPFVPGQPVTFFWSVRSGEPGPRQGTVWLYLRFIPKAGGEEIRIPISSQSIEINATTFFGLHGEMAQMLGVLGVLTGVILGFSFFIDGIMWLLKVKPAKRVV